MLAFIADGAFESYRVTVNGVDLNNNEDPYDYIYQNLPDLNNNDTYKFCKINSP